MENTENKSFGEGDVVKLKSGGPKMTVVKYTDESCKCIYWEDRNGFITVNLQGNLLMKAKD